ncbi:hypothetical protein GCM10008931_42960 [Oceanobacillus oncorhynchi subsp. oncorhynchi]|uniref:hypothetical protein n=1 Tax=Oceanobacillus oncorhynchi TaxID=545501 RepID=UPI0031E06100
MNNDFRRLENESVKDYKVRICSNKEQYNLSWENVRQILNTELGEKHGESKYRKWWYAFADGLDYQKDKLGHFPNTLSYGTSEESISLLDTNEQVIPKDQKFSEGTIDAAKVNVINMANEDEELPPYKETTEILKDGMQRSDKLVWMNQQQRKDPDFLLEAHGYDPKEWELTSSKSSMWNQHNKKHGTVILYSSKISVKPATSKFDWEGLVNNIETYQHPAPLVEFKGHKDDAYRTLNIPLFDLHFGINTFEDYQPTLNKILNILENNTYKEIIIPIGQDGLHNNDFNGQTANGTRIDKVDMVKAWGDMHKFYNYIIDAALESSEIVKIVFSSGNHDFSLGWSFVKMLEAEYGKSENAYRMGFDTRVKERKAFLLGNVFIGITHGDKARKNAAALFSVEFPQYWAQSKTREVYMGHLHRKRATKKETELIHDNEGIIVRELGTGNKIDQYHEDNGYTMAHREFEIFEYDKDKKTHIYYV